VFRARDPLLILGQAVAVGVGTIVALTLAGWPSNAAEAAWAGLAGAVVGLLIALGIEHVVWLHREVRRLQHIERESTAAAELREEERRLWSYQLALEQRRFAVSEATFQGVCRRAHGSRSRWPENPAPGHARARPGDAPGQQHRQADAALGGVEGTDARPAVVCADEAGGRAAPDARLAGNASPSLSEIEPRLGALEGDYRGHEGVRRWWSDLLGT